MKGILVTIVGASLGWGASLDLRHVDVNGPNAAVQLNNLGAKYYTEARYAEAEALYRLALKAWEKRGGEPPADMALTLGNLGTVLRLTGRYDEAEKAITASVERLEAAGDRQAHARALTNLASLYRAKGDLAKAEATAGRAAADPNQPLILASIYVEQRRYAEAETLLRGMLPSSQPRVEVTVFNDLATVSIARGDMSAAEISAVQAVGLARKQLPAGHPALATALNNLGQVYRFEGRFLDAEHCYREAIDLWESTLGPDHPDLARGLTNLAAFYHDRAREAGAEALYLRAAAIFERSFGKNDPLTLVARNELADVLRGEKRLAESERLGRATLAALEKVLGPGDSRVERARSHLAQLFQEKVQLAKAK